MSRLRVALAAAFTLCAAALAPAGAHAAVQLNPQLAKAPDVAHVDYDGTQHLHYRYGPIQITPGQNTIVFKPNVSANLKPSVPGYITRFQPNLTYTNGKIPPVDVVHLHHGVWLMRNYPTMAAGEEKTILQLPRGYGYRYDPSDPWLLNYMLHNLLPNRTQVYITWDVDFVPADAAGAQGITEVKPLWMDVAGLKAYPVFDAVRGSGGAKARTYTFPQQARGAQASKVGPAHQFTAPEDMTLVGTAGHLHPGGLYTDLSVSRGDQSRELFHSEAKYFEPAGAVSWDVAMTGTNADWRPVIRKGDTLRVSSTYDVSKASWYEVMGIMVAWYSDGARPEGQDPFTQQIDTRGTVTHGHLAENDNHGGTGQPILPDAKRMLGGSRISTVNIKDFIYGAGDLTLTGRVQRPPTVKQGQSLTFRNLDSPQGQDPNLAIYHTITACKAPCNKATGVAYPVADGTTTFDSGELGYGPSFATAAANRATWKTPKSLSPGTYNYFCRVHPFMRGAFRVVPR